MDQGPKPVSLKAPEGMRTFSLLRENKPGSDDRILEGVQFSTGVCVVHWLHPAPRGSLAFWDSINDFIDSFVRSDPHHTNIILFSDGQRFVFRPEGSLEPLPSVEEEIESLFKKKGKNSIQGLFNSLHSIDSILEKASEGQVQAIVEEFLRAYSKKSEEPHGHDHGHKNTGDGHENHEESHGKKDDHNKEKPHKGEGKK